MVTVFVRNWFRGCVGAFRQRRVVECCQLLSGIGSWKACERCARGAPNGTVSVLLRAGVRIRPEVGPLHRTVCQTPTPIGVALEIDEGVGIALVPGAAAVAVGVSTSVDGGW